MATQRAKQVRTESVVLEFLRNNGDLTKAAAGAGIKPATGKVKKSAEDILRDKMKAVLKKHEEVLLGGTSIPKGEVGYEEGKDNKYEVIFAEGSHDFERSKKMVAKLKTFDVLTKDNRGRKSGGNSEVWNEIDELLS